MPDDRIPIVAPPAYVVLVQAALGERYHVTASMGSAVALPNAVLNGVAWSCGHYHLTRQEAAECVSRQAGALC